MPPLLVFLSKFQLIIFLIDSHTAALVAVLFDIDLAGLCFVVVFLGCVFISKILQINSARRDVRCAACLVYLCRQLGSISES